MADSAEFVALVRNWRTALVLLATFGLTLVVDLTAGIVTGCPVAAVIYLIDRLKAVRS
jgi:SulP family sulfate permease